MRDLGMMKCERCGKKIKRHGTKQKYCRDCSEIMDRIRKTKWAREHYKTPDKREMKHRYNKKKEIMKKRGIDISNEVKRSITWITDCDDDINHLVRISFPFRQAYSKNAIYSMTGRGGHMFLKDEQRALRKEMILRFRKIFANEHFYQDKIWLDILVQKPDHRGDAINIIDSLCDILKKSIDIDDKWYSIRKLDWEIIKENPMIYLGVGQKSDGNKKVCSTCGRILPLSSFGNSKSGQFGKGRDCLECCRIRDKQRRKEKRERTKNF